MPSIRKRLTTISGVNLLATFLIAPDIVAQENKNKTFALEEIIVTAQKRAESLDKIPMAISAFDQKAMEKQGSTSLADNISLVPNMQNGTGGLTIRGIGTTSVRTAAPTVAIHYDGVYSDSDPRGLSGNVDIQRVEVVRGPQGTLYGRNATAGAVNFITYKPSSEFEFIGDTGFTAPGDALTTRMIVSGPLSDSLGARLALSRAVGDGTLENPTPGEADGNSADTLFGRLNLAWQLSEKLAWDIGFEYEKTNGIDGPFQADWYVSKPDASTAIVYPTGFANDEVPTYGPDADQFGNYEERNSGPAKRQTLRSTLAYDLSDTFSISWIAGFQDKWSQANYHGLPIVIVDYTLRGNDFKQESNFISNELNLSFDGDWGVGVVGLYHYKKALRDTNNLHIWVPSGSDGPDNPPELTTAISIANTPLGENVDESKAVFSQFTFALSGSTRLTAGLRYSNDGVEMAGGLSTFCLFGDFQNGDQAPSQNCQLLALLPPGDPSGLGGLFGVNENPKADEEWSNVSWKLVVDHDFSDTTLGYATVSTGYKQGSIPGNDEDGAIVVEPETNTNYELGLRSQLFDRSLNLNLTLFWMDYQDLQVSVSAIVNGAPAVTFKNAASALSRGAEFEWNWQLSESDRIDGFITYLDASFEEWNDSPDSFRGAAFTFDAAGNKLPNAPEYTFRIGYTHIFSLGEWGELAPSISTYYSGDSYVQHTNGPQDYNPDYWRSDVFVRYNTVDERFFAEAYVSNIEDKRRKTTFLNLLSEASQTGPGGGIQYVSYSSGQTVGMRLGVRF